MISLAELLFWFCGEWIATSLLGGAVSRGDFGFRVGDRFEKLVNGVPIVQGRVIGVVKREGEQLNDDRILTIEWDDGTQTIGRPEEALRSARHIHPLAPRLDRSTPPH